MFIIISKGTSVDSEVRIKRAEELLSYCEKFKKENQDKPQPQE